MVEFCRTLQLDGRIFGISYLDQRLWCTLINENLQLKLWSTNKTV